MAPSARTTLLLILSSAVRPASSVSQAREQWPWSKKHAKSEAKHQDPDPVVHTEDIVKHPSHPGCYMRMPSGCPKNPMRTQLWRHDTWAEEHGLDKAACQQRKSVWDSYCGSQDAIMTFVDNETRSEPVSALQISHKSQWRWQWPWGQKSAKREDMQAMQAKIVEEAVTHENVKSAMALGSEYDGTLRDPKKPGCYMRISSFRGCPTHPMKSLLWRHDTFAELNLFDEKACLQRKITWSDYCKTKDVLMTYVGRGNSSERLSALQISSGSRWPWGRRRKDAEAKDVENKAERAEAAQAPAESAEGTVAAPSRPGCYMRMPSGCPKRPMRTQLWRHDTWAEKRDLDEAACQQRKSVWDGYCDSQDAIMAFVPKQ